MRARVILHLDMDAFYAAVEAREDPSLAGRPVIVGHRGARGVVATCSYEARHFGVHSAMPSIVAERRCPQALWLAPRMDLYVRVSDAIGRILHRFSPAIEALSIDEAFVDLTGIAADLVDGRRLGQKLKRAILDEERLTASVGLAPNKFLAKLASELDKPDGLTVLAPEDLPSRVWPLPVRRLWGVGPRTAERLRRGGVETIGAVLRVEPRELARLVGASAAAHLGRLARGEDERRVAPERSAKSISEERTYARDLADPREIDRALLERAEGVARQLRCAGLVGRTVEIKVRRGDYRTWTRAAKLAEPTDLAEPILAAARRLLLRVPLGGAGVRLLGLGLGDLAPAGAAPPRLFTDPVEARARRLARAADAVRERLGEHAVTRARLLDGGGTDPRLRRRPSSRRDHRQGR
jgi:DNA polymerase-4